MFERFTKEARSTVQHAVAAAQASRSPAVDTRHLLMALLEAESTAAGALRAAGLDRADVAERARRDVADDATLDGAALAAVGVDLEEVRRRTDEVFGTGALERAGARGSRRGRHTPFTDDAKKALELALREAIRLKDRSIDGDHLLLGILRADCPGGRVLAAAARDAGTDVVGLRSAVEAQRSAA